MTETLSAMAIFSSFRERVRARERVLGTVVASSDPALAELVGDHFDFIWIDLEHSPLTLRDVQALCIAARAAGCGTLARLPTADAGGLTALLDIGVDGIVAPRVEAVDVAARVAKALRDSATLLAYSADVRIYAEAVASAAGAIAAAWGAPRRLDPPTTVPERNPKASDG